ncbi:MAG: hypothetical protein HZC41_08075 [Chloroflexi bacterium]|nr:hypothetical protein [Chloroflexota bacterium]
MPSLFDITASQSRVNLDSQRRGEVSFTVTNTGGRLVRGRARIVPQGTAAPEWFTLEGNAERNFDVAGVQTYLVQIAVAAAAPAGNYVFRLDMLDVANPDEFYTEGPAVAFEVKGGEIPPDDEEPPPPKGYVTTVVGAVVGILAGLTAGIILGIILGVIVNSINNDLAGFVAVGTIALVPWIGSSLGVYIALNTRKLGWPRETAGVFAAVIFVWSVVSVLVTVGMVNALTSGTLEGILFFFIILPLWLIAPGLIARAIVLRWKTGSF